MGRIGAIAGLAVIGFASLALAQVNGPSPMAPAGTKTGSLPQGGFFSVKGYLAPGSAPDSLLINPPAPIKGSATEKRDVEAAKAAIKLQGTARWAFAKRDAEIFVPNVTSIFSCAAGVALGGGRTPATDNLLLRSMRDLGMSTSPTKRKYMRQRPFMVNGKPICTPDAEKTLRGDGSYPSGHAAIGYGMGLILAELIPGRSAQLVARGRAFADSRRVCNVHWLSDTEEGSLVGSAVVARLHADPAFRADLETARSELAALGTSAPPTEDCAAEAAALAVR
ncbi:MAG: acid phosphatase [Novosphingobium sp.]